jgi:hypothetical protein
VMKSISFFQYFFHFLCWVIPQFFIMVNPFFFRDIIILALPFPSLWSCFAIVYVIVSVCNMFNCANKISPQFLQYFSYSCVGHISFLVVISLSYFFILKIWLNDNKKVAFFNYLKIYMSCTKVYWTWHV